MVVRKILIDLRQFWPRGRCLLKRDFHSFQNHDTHLKEFKLKVYLQETPLVYIGICEIVESISSSNTFCIN